MIEKNIEKPGKSNLRNRRDQGTLGRHGDCVAHHGCQQDQRLLDSVGEPKEKLGARTAAEGPVGTRQQLPRATLPRRRLCVTHRLVATLAYPLHGAADPGTVFSTTCDISPLLRGHVGGCQISRSERHRAALIPAAIGSLAHHSHSISVLNGYANCQYKAEGGTSAFVSPILDAFPVRN